MNKPCHSSERKSDSPVISRRDFLGFSACAICLAACNRSPKSKPPRSFAVAKLSELEEGVNVFELKKVALFKDGEQIRALSLNCTHQDCLVLPAGNRLQCSCHGAEFSMEGEVLSGPASRDLEKFDVKVSSAGEVVVSTRVR